MNTPDTPLETRTRRLHVGLAVRDVRAATDFYRSLLGAEPAKVRSDYAKFELDDPALVLSLVPETCCGGERADHFGLRLETPQDVRSAEEELTARGLAPRRESVTCCHARQEKLWLTDPDGNPWEVYTVLGDVD